MASVNKSNAYEVKQYVISSGGPVGEDCKNFPCKAKFPNWVIKHFENFPYTEGNYKLLWVMIKLSPAEWDLVYYGTLAWMMS
jgi:hypothetical protein